MRSASYPWRPLGALLVEKGLLSAEQVETALAAQRKSGQPLGELLVSYGWITAEALTLALAEQHGVELQAPQGSSEGNRVRPASWRPLGRVLIELGALDEAELEEALAEQRASSKPLGRVLVESGRVSATALAEALAAQQGVELETGRDPWTTLRFEAPEPLESGARFEVREQRGLETLLLHTTTTFLDATDLAFDVLYDREPEALQIVRVEGEKSEVVWRWSRDGEPEPEARRGSQLFDRYGYPVTRWNAAPWLSPRER